ncbi:OB-fold nucleic acid binding domain-containing protein [Paenibacillus sp. GP183]|uniref:OB-fold nucleic acid binding domain-containing protein n=1 Tax=Paenibacillus sp. GP183 TaxID=1882751 RepID=UPI000B8A50ED|nr:OB-fold nucleic acid binding domain-containing protein [Paenibacillus sp. GP183]
MKLKFYVLWALFIVVLVGGYFLINKKDLFSGDQNKVASAVTPTSQTISSTTALEKGNTAPTVSSSIVSIRSINSKMKGQTVTIKASIKDKKQSKDGHLFLTVEDSSGLLDVPVFADKKVPTDLLIVNKVFQITGQVDVYNGKLEIIPQQTGDIILASDSLEVTKANSGKTIEFQATVLTKYLHPDGHMFLKVKRLDTNEEVEVPVFSNLNYNTESITINAQMKIKGQIQEYKNQMEVIPQNAADLTILKEGDENQVILKSLSEISDKDRGKMFQVRGSVKGVADKDGHLFFTMYLDNNKEMKAVLFRADGKEIVGRKTKIQSASKEGFPIHVLALVDIYNGNLELIINKVYNDY